MLNYRRRDLSVPAILEAPLRSGFDRQRHPTERGSRALVVPTPGRSSARPGSRLARAHGPRSASRVAAVSRGGCRARPAATGTGCEGFPGGLARVSAALSETFVGLLMFHGRP
jgi:hypothetical protein